MTARLKDTIRRVLRVGPEPAAEPVETPFIQQMRREQVKSERRRRAYQDTSTRDLSRAFAPPVWKQGRG